MNMEIQIPEDDPVRMASAQLVKLDYRELYRAYSSLGRKSAAEPRIIFEVLVYGYMYERRCCNLVLLHLAAAT